MPCPEFWPVLSECWMWCKRTSTQVLSRFPRLCKPSESGIEDVGTQAPLIIERLRLITHETCRMLSVEATVALDFLDRRMARSTPRAPPQPLFDDFLNVILKLLTSEEPITVKNDRWNLRDARLHLRPYSNPLFDIALPAVAAIAEPRLAGQYGVGLLSSIGATAGFDTLAVHWEVMEAQALNYKTRVDRNRWRLVGMLRRVRRRQ